MLGNNKNMCCFIKFWNLLTPATSKCGRRCPLTAVTAHGKATRCGRRKSEQEVYVPRGWGETQTRRDVHAWVFVFLPVTIVTASNVQWRRLSWGDTETMNDHFKRDEWLSNHSDESPSWTTETMNDRCVRDGSLCRITLMNHRPHHTLGRACDPSPRPQHVR